MKDMKVKLTLVEEALGMMPTDKELYENYIASKAPDAKTTAEEVEEYGVDAVVEKGRTVFPRDEEGRPFIYDYQIRGFFKDAIGMLRMADGTASAKVKAYKKRVDGLIFVLERKIPIEVKGEMGECQRPLRTDGPTGSRTALASSETVPAGSTLEFTIRYLAADLEPVIRECLDYGLMRGICQWRNSGKGRFVWEEAE